MEFNHHVRSLNNKKIPLKSKVKSSRLQIADKLGISLSSNHNKLAILDTHPPITTLSISGRLTLLASPNLD